MQTRKHTAWKKNRKFGDVMGGRKRPKLADNKFNGQHNLTAPNEREETPIFILDNPSRDFYFPVTVEEVKETLNRLPKDCQLPHYSFIQKLTKSLTLNNRYEKDKIYRNPNCKGYSGT